MNWIWIFVAVIFASGNGSENVLSPQFDFRKYLLSKPLKNFLLENPDDITENCEEAMLRYISGLLGGEIWALQMVDSIPKFMDGLLMGRLHYPGHFDECVEVRVPSFQGKHCMVQIAPKLNQTPGNDVHARDLMDPRIIFNYGICIPSACTTKDLNILLNNLNLTDTLGLINVTDHDCSTSEWRPYRPEDLAAVILIIVLFAVAVVSTIYDVKNEFSKENKRSNPILASFSFYSNLRYLFRVSQSAAQLKCVHGIRFLSIAWVVLGHAYISLALAAPLNFKDVSNYMLSSSLLPIGNSVVAVDTFFFLSGLLVCLVFFRDISKKGYFDVPVAFIHRYIRLTPSYALVVLLQATVLTRIGNGPFWNQHMDRMESDCRKSWWSGILYVQNYVHPEALCLGQNWYLSTDMQMFWASPVFLYPILIWPAFAPVFLVLVTLAAAFTNFTIAYLNELHPTLSLALGYGDLEHFKIDYIPFHTRLSSWLVGLSTGYIICGIQANKIRINLTKTMVVIGWSVGLGLLFTSFFAILRFYEFEYTPLESAFYLAFHRLGWTLGLSWILLACVSGYGGPINNFLGWDGFQPLAKLSYSIFLVHMSFQMYRLYRSRVNQYIENFNIVHAYLGDLIVSTVLAIPLTLLVEVPFVLIDRHFFQKMKIFPFPRRARGKMKDEILRSQAESAKDVENGIPNPTFKES